MPIPASSAISISSVSDRVWSFCVVTRLLPGGGSPRAIPAGLSGNQKAEDCEKASEFLENSKNGVIFAKRSSLHIVNLTRHSLFLVLETWKISTKKSQSRCPCCFSARADTVVFLVGFPGPRVRSQNSVRVLFARADTVVFFVDYPGPRVRSRNSVRVLFAAGRTLSES